jgi:hypothetical protein
MDMHDTKTALTVAPEYSSMAAGLALFMEDKLFDRARQLANIMAKADGFMPRHLQGKPEACFAVIDRAITWRLSPYAVALSTYMTPGGSIGFEGKLCQAILENSGHLAGPVEFEHFGDWSKVQGQFEIRTSDKGSKYAAPKWTDKDAVGLGVIVRAQVRGEKKVRELRFELIQAFPRNSTLWATDPKTQICYTAVRRFAATAVPAIFMGMPFDIEDTHGRVIDMGEAVVDEAPADNTAERMRNAQTMEELREIYDNLSEEEQTRHMAVARARRAELKKAEEKPAEPAASTEPTEEEKAQILAQERAQATKEREAESKPPF